MMASCFDNILHDNLQKIRLHRNDLLLPRFWPDHRSKLVSALIKSFIMHLCFCMLHGRLNPNLFMLSTQSPAIQFCVILRA